MSYSTQITCQENNAKQTSNYFCVLFTYIDVEEVSNTINDKLGKKLDNKTLAQQKEEIMVLSFWDKLEKLNNI